jgi:hypothetical protein
MACPFWERRCKTEGYMSEMGVSETGLRLAEFGIPKAVGLYSSNQTEFKCSILKK